MSVPDVNHPQLRFDPPHRTPGAPAHAPGPSPDEVRRFVAIVFEPAVQLPEIAALVESSPGLELVVLQAANSADFGLVQPVVRISHATAVLGLRRLQYLARTLSALLGEPIAGTAAATE